MQTHLHRINVHMPLFSYSTYGTAGDTQDIGIATSCAMQVGGDRQRYFCVVDASKVKGVAQPSGTAPVLPLPRS